MADLHNELVWSHSRARAFGECLRAYWFTYYGSWGGWDVAAPPRARQAYLEKKLTTRAMWTGTVVHGVAEDSLRAARDYGPPSLAEATRRARNQARRDIEDSWTGRWEERPARRTGFAEHYYGREVTDADWDAAIAEIERQVGILYGHRIFRRLLQVPERIREVEDLRRFTVDGADVYVVLDVLVDDGRGGVVIIDWKTGDAHSDAEIAGQLGVYGLYATRELGVPVDKVTALHVNLRHDTETRHAVGPEQIDRARSTLAESVAAMRARLVDIAENVADEADFQPLAEDDRRCRWCNFRRVCGRETAPAVE